MPAVASARGSLGIRRESEPGWSRARPSRVRQVQQIGPWDRGRWL